MKTVPLLWALALAAGALIPVQAAANAALSKAIGDNVPFAALTLFAVAAAATALGVGNAIALVVTGQVMAALAIDHFGLMRSLTFPLTPARAVGAVLMVIGVFLALRR